MTMANYEDLKSYQQSGRGRPDEPAFLDVRNLMATLRGSLPLILGTMIAFAVLAVVISLILPKSYVASTRILVDPRGLRVVENEVTPPSQTTDANSAIVESQMRVMISDSVLSKVVVEQNLGTDPEFGAKRGTLDGVQAMFGMSGNSTETPELRALRALWSAVSVNRTPESYIIDLSVKTGDPVRSAQIATAIADTYVNSEVEQRGSTARRASAALFGRLDELRNNLTRAEEAVERYRSENRIIEADGAFMDEQQVAQLNAELTRAQVETSRAEEKYQQISRAVSSGAGIESLPEVLLSSTIARLREVYVATYREERSLSRDLMGRHPSLVRAREELAALRSQLDAEISRIAVSAERELDRARDNQTRLETLVQTSMNTSLGTKQALVQLRELQRNAQASKMVYESYLMRAHELEEQQGLNTTSARIISEALPPEKPRGLSLAAVLVLALAAGAGVGASLALARAAMD
ncbi:GumC family protein [Mesorhizobium sp. CAU 1732]|uniref:GumC family protein n=1 Tax=Mesorhizobium sp. CAU 1732 TaxID=3140358 RepID=UPI003261AA5B